MQHAIRVEKVSKQYQIGKRVTHGSLNLTETLFQSTSKLWRMLSTPAALDPDTTFWALRDVSFDVQPGEVVGVIGRNGAGKSTLLKILSRIVEPTSGRVEFRGQMASLLEVGTGFHPELSGRENVYLNGSLLGMKRREIDRKFDDIVGFSEIEQFIDTPVKRYSSGMYVRLAFAVAAFLDLDVLIVDEILAVGDAGFQKKCLGKIGDAARNGRTVLLVSHNMIAVQALCKRVVWLEQGRLVADGDSHEVARKYLGVVSRSVGERQWSEKDAPGNKAVRLMSVRALGSGGSISGEFTNADEFQIEFRFRVLEDGIRLNLTMAFYNEEEVCVFTSPSITDNGVSGRPFACGTYESQCYIPGHFLNDGLYRVDVLFVKDTTTVLFNAESVLMIDIHDEVKNRGDWHGKWAGVVRPRFAWRTVGMTETNGHSRDEP